jgi:hypothetical protein
MVGLDDTGEADLVGPATVPDARCFTGAHEVVLNPVGDRSQEVLGAAELRDGHHGFGTSAGTLSGTLTATTGSARPKGWQVSAGPGLWSAGGGVSATGQLAVGGSKRSS